MSRRAQKNHDPLIGHVIDGRYEILQRVGEGGMGVVYRARQVSIDRIIAIKMLNKEMANDKNWVDRFYNEAKACSRLQHPNTIRMFDFGQTREGKLFMTMEFLDGHSLRHAIAAGAPMAPARVLKILIQCCASLSEAHSFKIIHRDIKPDNVFLLNLAGSPDFVKLLDFSVAKLLQASAMRTQAGVVFGTPQYMSPEQGRGVPLDVRSDLYSLGILAYEMLTGQVPFDDSNPMNVLQMHMQRTVPPLGPNVPPAVRNIVESALDKDPNRRFQSAGEMMQVCQETFAQIGAQAAGMLGMHSQPMPQHAPQPMHGAQPVATSAAAKTMFQADGGFGPPPAVNHGPPLGHGPPPAAPGPGPMPAAPVLPRAHAAPGQLPSSARTMIADLNGAPIQAGAPIAAGGDAASAKTVVASVSSIPGAASLQDPPMMPFPPTPMPQSSPAKTMMLQDSEGVVSFTNSGSQPIQRPALEHYAGGHNEAIDSPEPPGFLFWTICLTAGLVIGVLGYLILIKVS